MRTASEAAALGLLIAYAFDMHVAQRTVLMPPADARLLPEWNLVGYLAANDALFRYGRELDFGDAVCYGYLAQSVRDPSQFVCALRGTQGIIEWIEDAKFLLVPHKVGGRVEAGFWGIYDSMKYVPVTGGLSKAALGIAHAIGSGTLTVIGHSLGGPLATYLTLDLAQLLGLRVSGVFFASPRPGDTAFAGTFDARVKDYQVFNYVLDVVPRVPFGQPFSDLPRVTWISPHLAQARISFDLRCHHHVLCYSAMLDYALTNWIDMPPIDRECSVCIKGALNL